MSRQLNQRKYTNESNKIVHCRLRRQKTTSEIQCIERKKSKNKFAAVRNRKVFVYKKLTLFTKGKQNVSRIDQ